MREPLLTCTEPRPGVHLAEFNDKRVVTIPRVQQLDDELHAMIDAMQHRSILILDCSELDIGFMGVAKLKAAKRLLDSKQCKLTLANPSDIMVDVIDVGNFNNIFDCRQHAGGARAVVDALAKPPSIRRY